MTTKAKKLFSSRAFKSGSYAAVLSAVAVAICVLINIIFQALPTTFRQLDLSSTGIFSLSSESENAVKALQQEVTIFYLAETANEDMAVKALLDKYNALSGKIKVEYKDPVLYPTFAAQYDAQGASAGSLIVVSGEKSKLISANELYQQTPNYTTYTYDTAFAGEMVITSAISYVTRTQVPKIYTLDGHSAALLSTSVTDALSRKNYETAQLNLLSEGSVPQDASCVVIYSPEKDLSAEELTALRNYLLSGGSLMLSSDYAPSENFVNLNTLLAEFGLINEYGIIIEGDANMHLQNYSYYLLPDIINGDITKPLVDSGSFTIMPMAFPITYTEEIPDGVTHTSILSSSSKSYLKEAGYEAQTIEKEANDLEGPFNVAVLAEKTTEEATGKIIWFSSTGILDEVSDSMVNGSNADLFINSLSYLCGSAQDIAITAKAVTTPIVTISAGSVQLLTIICVIALPVLLIVIGFVIWLKRRRK